jgi:hypothetical protein
MKILLSVFSVLIVLGLLSPPCQSYTILGYDVDYIGDYISCVGSYFTTSSKGNTNCDVHIFIDNMYMCLYIYWVLDCICSYIYMCVYLPICIHNLHVSRWQSMIKCYLRIFKKVMELLYLDISCYSIKQKL